MVTATANQKGKIDKSRFGGDYNMHNAATIRMFLDKKQNIWASTGNRLYQFLDLKDNQVIEKDSVIHFPHFNQSLYTDLKNGRNISTQDKWINTYNLGENVN